METGSKKQKLVTVSNVKSELRATAQNLCKLLRLKRVLEERLRGKD